MSAGSSGNRVVRVLMTALMAFGTPVYADAPGGGAGSADPAKGAPKCAKILYQDCEKEVKKAEAATQVGVAAAGAANKDGKNRDGVQTAGSTYTASAAQLKEAGQQCANIKKQCQTFCNKKGEENDRVTCEKHFDDRAAQLMKSGEDLGQSGAGYSGQAEARGAAPGDSAKPQSTPASGGGGGGGMGAGMMGAMAGMAAGMMMAQMMNKDQEQQQQQQNMGAIQSDGSVNCSAPDAVNFSACNPYFSQSCTAAIAAGAFSTSAGCQTFAARYCSAPNASAAQIAQAAQSGLPVVGATGEGLSENPAFCQKVLASNFCAQPGRGGCPSCQSLSAQLGSACTTNPTLCLAQSSTTTLETARLTCPTDPMFANPAYAMGGAATVVTGGSGLATSVPVTGGTIVGGAPVVLPQSASASGAATREGVTRSAASTGMSAQSVGAGSGGTQSVRAGGGDRVATAGGGAAVAYNGASAVNTAGPAPDVQGQFGPSLFSTSSQAIRSRCESGRLNCR